MQLHKLFYFCTTQANCKDQQYVKQVEGFLNNQHKFSFIAQTEEDMNKLKREVCSTVAIIFILYSSCFVR